MSRYRNLMRCGLVALAVGCGWRGAPAAADGIADYRLGPQDELKIRVYDWRPELGETHQWEALTGDFVVGAAGDISLPLVGEVPARGLTTAQLSATLAERLQAKVGLAHPATASVEIKQYRPFYVVGLVDKPGEYAYRPGLTVLQAITVAGGLHRAGEINLLDYEHRALVDRGDLRAMAVERTQLMLRQARLAAEIDGAALDLPAQLASQRSDPALATAVAEEQRLLDIFNASLTNQSDMLQKSKSLLQHELVVLAAKDAALGRQLDANGHELAAISGLVNKGLVITPRQTALQQNQAQFESARLDVGLATLRAQQQMSQIDRDASDVRNKAREIAMKESEDVRARLASIAQKMETAENLIYQSEVRAPEVMLTAERRNRLAPHYYLTRAGANAQPTTLQVQDDDPLLPGDTLRVQRAPESLDVAATTDR